ncbi:MAG: aldehyde dehydrogenase family protein, partial [Actinobacteria bacterium]|nr:aldehyde dehydrogenase family protein [Actinomycetota bacterium]
RLRRAQPEWQESLEHRTAELSAWRDAIAAARTRIIDALIADTGRRIESEMEVDAVLGSIARWCAIAPELLADPARRPSAIPFIGVEQSLRPYELAGVISPWNFPLLLALLDAIPALVAGCAVIVKPSEIAPRFIEPLVATVPGGLPIAFIAGDGSTGSTVIDNVDALCFTGSVATGRRVAEQAARRFIPAFLELGGKDPAVVLASADLERATSAILWGSTANAGQSCQSIERVYVAASLYETFVEMVTEKASRVELAAPTIEDGAIGPIIAEKQIAIIASQLEDAATKGAKARTGGAIETIDGGTYLRPTVLTDVDHTMKVMTEETFGPIIPVMSFEDDDDAVRLANDTIFGLSAAVFGAEGAAIAVARRLNAGGVSINDAALTALVHDAEKNSFNLSGLGSSRMGPAALRRFGRRQAFLINGTPAPDPWWYPTLR